MRQDVYRTAYDEARAELAELMSEFERLRVRKEQLEKVRETLKPLADPNGNESVEEIRPANTPSYTF
ncbi:MAG TPA: hypothetical protein VFI20_11580 [Terracidiphilus sp.]|nr:hypothetical protein [Terracidiphilus sp.]